MRPTCTKPIISSSRQNLALPAPVKRMPDHCVAFRLFGAFTLDVIAGTGFGLDTNSLVDNHGNLFLDSVARLFASEGVVTAVTLVTSEFRCQG